MTRALLASLGTSTEMLDPSDLWPDYCANCDRGFIPENASHFCSACIKAFEKEEEDE